MERERLSKNIREREGVQCLRAMDNDYTFAKKIVAERFSQKIWKKGNPPWKSSRQILPYLYLYDMGFGPKKRLFWRGGFG